VSADASPATTVAVQTVRWANWIYGSGGPRPDDQAEEYHEASKLAPGVIDAGARGSRLLEASPEMRVTAARAVKRYRQASLVALPAPRLPRTPLGAAIARRRSERSFAASPLALAELATLLAAGYGVTGMVGGQPVRSVPSGGALYPLELYVVAQRVDGLDPALYHFDPFRRALEHLRAVDGDDTLRDLSPYGPLLADAAAVILVTAMFWRTRFKYGLRGYRFALLEAGHVGQNLTLTATALGLASVPVGGVYDRRVDELLGVDGVNESIVYACSVGHGTP
jgi:SagB-type dehydrogenase family enzyme